MREAGLNAMTALDTGFGIAVDLCVRSVLGQDNLWPPACHTLKVHLAEAPCHIALDFVQKETLVSNAPSNDHKCTELRSRRIVT